MEASHSLINAGFEMGSGRNQARLCQGSLLVNHSQPATITYVPMRHARPGQGGQRVLHTLLAAPACFLVSIGSSP